MRSDRLDDAATESEPETGAVYRLLDPAFGFGVWALHLLVVYVSTAVACQLGLASRDASVQSSVLMTLIAITLVAAAVVVAHAVRRYHQHDHGFLARLAVGHDAVAALAILWQLMPLMMVPLCR
jgi:hypothetical protein